MLAIRRKTLFGMVLALGASLGLMAAGPEDGVKPGERAPDFTLTDTTGKEYKLSELLKNQSTTAVVLEWFNADCPYVVRHYREKTMTELAAKYKEKGVIWLAVNTGAEGKQGAGQARNQKARDEWKIEYPILLDPTGDTGRAYGAKTTPHMFVITPDGVVAYAGGIDNDSRGRMNDEEKINYVDRALESVLSGSSVETPSAKPYGCSVKY
ncbi:MAG: thioredoxin family protein [Phycisphaerales bacterium JB039]